MILINFVLKIRTKLPHKSKQNNQYMISYVMGESPLKCSELLFHWLCCIEQADSYWPDKLCVAQVPLSKTKRVMLIFFRQKKKMILFNQQCLLMFPLSHFTYCDIGMGLTWLIKTSRAIQGMAYHKALFFLARAIKTPISDSKTANTFPFPSPLRVCQGTSEEQQWCFVFDLFHDNTRNPKQSHLKSSFPIKIHANAFNLFQPHIVLILVPPGDSIIKPYTRRLLQLTQETAVIHPPIHPSIHYPKSLI